MFEAEAKQIMPNLSELWYAELQVWNNLKPLCETMQQDVRLFPLKKFLKTGLGTPIIIDTRKSDKEAGRPLDLRTIQASLKLLLFAPYEVVLEQEKAWRIEIYMAALRDKNVTLAVRRERHRAIRDAHMCVTRAHKIVAEFLEYNPGLLVPYIILSNIARDWNKVRAHIGNLN